MQSVTTSFSPYSDVRFSDMRVDFRLIDLTAFSDATATASGSNAVSQLAQTHDEIDSIGKKWASLENGGWFTDGTYEIMPDVVTSEQTGWWSDVLSDEDGLFDSNPQLIFDFTNNHSSIGFTVIFDDKANIYPAEFIIYAYDSSDVLIDSQTFACTSAFQVVDMPVENYRKIIIEFTETQLPFQRVRVAEVIFGIIQNFDKENISNGKILYQISPTAEFLASNELEITFDNSDRKYNMINPDTLFAFLQQTQRLDVQIAVGEQKNDLEYVKMGRFYFSKSQAQDDSMSATITAYDKFFMLENSICRIGTTGTWTVTEAVTAVIADSGLTITTSIPTAIASMVINKCIPQSSTHREALRLIAQAAMCTCYFDRNDVLVFVALNETTVVDTLDNDNMQKVAQIEVLQRFNTVELNVYNEYTEAENLYTANDIASGETVKILSVDNPLVADANGTAVAEWLLEMANKRLWYDLQERGNPAREICDTVKIYDAYNENRNAIITKEEYSFDGTLQANSECWGG